MTFNSKAEEWKEYKLSELTTLISRGITPAYTEDVSIGVTVLNQKCIRDNRINFEPSRLTNPNKKKITENKILEEGDILVNSTGVGTLGRVAQFNEKDKQVTVDSHVTIVRANNLVDSKFLGYNLFMNQRFIEHLGEGSTGQTELSRVRLGEAFKLFLPPLGEQKAIAKILSDLDEKIETNNKINKNLEEMAQAIFKQWFVDFEFPNEEGKPYKSSGGEMVESELGMIPKGWNVGSLKDIGEIIGGATPSKKKEEYFINGSIPWLTPKDLSSNKNLFISSGELNITEEAYNSTSVKLMPRNTVLFSSRAPIGYIAIAKNDITTNQGFKSIVPKKEIGMSANYIYCLLNNIKPIIESRATGSTFKEISGGEMKKIECIVPRKKYVEKFKNATESLFRKIENNEEESEKLEKLRDTLLPKLMSGEIRIPLN